MSDFLGLANKTILVTGVANKKSVAYFVSKALREAGANVVHVVRSEQRRAELQGLIGEALVCDVERQEEIDALAGLLAERELVLDGLVHSIAFANYADGLQPFHATKRADFLQALDVSCFSLVALAQALAPRFAPRASVVALSISTTTMAAESYGYMGPIKAALDSTVVFLAKSFAARGEVRFNAVKAGPLKTSASAGIPGYLDNYLYAEAATLRHRAVATDEVASTVLFLLSPKSSGLNAQGVVVDAGMGTNFFDAEIVRRFHRGGENAS
ncbi:MAG: SDR family oxidoreductase [Planctomycetes bacterium]|nr:SDR family oxidoreductase [Planctomycetota bacterium]